MSMPSLRAPEPVPPSVLHVVESLDNGAVETWLLRMLRHGRARGLPLDWTFYCTLDRAGEHEAAARLLGARVVHAPVPLDDKRGSMRALRRAVAEGGHDVLHGHHDLVCALYVAAVTGLPLRHRIVHVHNADENVLTASPLKQRLYRPLARRLCLARADRIVGISDHTLDTFLAGRARRPGRDIVHRYGIDPAPFTGPGPDREAFRTALGLPADAVVLLFGGRIVPEKNPLFAIDVLAALRQREPRAVAVFAGAGSLNDAVMQRARDLGVGNAVRLIGWRRDLPDVMRCADLFILPRPEAPMEGFGIAVVEAQLAGLRLLVSRGIADDPLLPSAAFRRLALAAGPQDWATAATDLLAAHAPSPDRARADLAASDMDMDRALAGLIALHA